MHQKIASPFRKLRNFGQNNQRSKEVPVIADKLRLASVAKCMQEVKDMRSKYEGLLTNGQIISGAAYDFARSLQCMASSMMESFTEVVDEELGHIFTLLAKVQFEMAKVLDLFAAHVSQTLIRPTEVLIENIEQAEIMMNSHDKERKLNFLSPMSKPLKRVKGHLRDENTVANKGKMQEKMDTITSLVQSLQSGQRDSLITQGVQYHSAHMYLFSKGFGSINAIEPMIRQVALNRMIDTTLPEEDMAASLFVNSSEMEPNENTDNRKSWSDSVASSSSNFLAKQKELTGYYSDSSGELHLKRPAAVCRSAPISPLRSCISEARGNGQVTVDHEPESVAMYVLPSPMSESGSLAGTNAIGKREKFLESLSKEFDNHEENDLKVPPSQYRPDMPINRQSPRPRREQFVHIKPEDSSNVKSFLFNRDLKLDVNNSNNNGLKGRRYTQSGPLIESPSSIKNSSGSGRGATSFCEEYTPPLYKSGPIHRSSHFAATFCDLSGPPPSMPYISELHKLPLPPGGSVTPPKSPNDAPSTTN